MRACIALLQIDLVSNFSFLILNFLGFVERFDDEVFRCSLLLV